MDFGRKHYGVSTGVTEYMDGGQALFENTLQRAGRKSFAYGSSKPRWPALVISCFLTFAIFHIAGSSQSPFPVSAAQHESEPLHRRQSSSGPLVDFEVSPPVTVPSASCQVTLMEYSFGNSYGHPFVGPYTPPSCAFNRVALNLTVTSVGRQFDRLGIIYLNDTEIWRTSTAEPTATGIIWTYVKDVSNYLPLWKQSQTVIFDLGNLINSIYTAPFDATLTAYFFTEADTPAAADVILPISAQQSSAGMGSAWDVPQQNATSTFSIPRNARRAVASIAAVGQIDEEFWWSNVPSSDVNTFGNNSLLGYSPFREVQLLIDGQLAGVAWPFPVIFTGGVVPGFWRPIVGIDAFDLREDEIDVTPWLSVLSDGLAHTFQIQVLGINDDGSGNGILTTVGNYWVVSGKLFLWLDEDGSVTTGSAITKSDPDPAFFVTSNVGTPSNGTNLTLNYQVLAQRQLSFSSTLTTSNGSQQVSWSQTLSFSNTGNLSDAGYTQANNQLTTGTNVASSGYSRQFAYPLYVWSSVAISSDGNNETIVATMDRAKNAQVIGPSAFPNAAESYAPDNPFDGASYDTRQNGSAFYFASALTNTSQSFGSTEQTLTLSGLQAGPASYPNAPPVESSQLLYSRHVLAVNGTVVEDSNPSPTSPSYTGPEQPVIENMDIDIMHGFAQPPQLSNMVGRNARVQKRGPMHRRAASFGILW